MAFLSRNLHRLFALLLVASLAAPAFAPARADDGLQLVEQKIKAGLLYNFLKYTQWPQGSAALANPSVQVCLLGGDPFDGHLAPMAGRTVNQRPIEIRNVRATDDFGTCSLLVVHADEKSSWPAVQKRIAGKSILTVGDFDDFTSVGGMIAFTRVDNRIGVEINVEAMDVTHLTVQDRLLKLASVVRPGARAP